MTKRVAFLTNEIPPYRRPLISDLSQVPGIQLLVLTSIAKEPWRRWDPAKRVGVAQIRRTPTISVHSSRTNPDLGTGEDRLIHLPFGTLPQLIFYRPDLVISSEFGLRSLSALAYCRIFERPLVIWSEETLHHAIGVSRTQNRLRRLISARANLFLAWGESAKDYLMRLNVPEAHIISCPQAVDNDFWSGTTSLSRYTAVRKRIGIRGKVALYVGRLIDMKGVDRLIRAWVALPRELSHSNTLLIVGSGKQEQSLRALARSTEQSSIHFLGPLEPVELRDIYGIADFFVFPSLLDVWGLVVNEAMAAGLPVLCSEYAGSRELIVEGVTGNLFDPNDLENLTEWLASWIEKASPTPDLTIQNHIRGWNLQAASECLVGGVLRALGTNSRNR